MYNHHLLRKQTNQLSPTTMIHSHHQLSPIILPVGLCIFSLIISAALPHCRQTPNTPTSVRFLVSSQGMQSPHINILRHGGDGAIT